MLHVVLALALVNLAAPPSGAVDTPGVATIHIHAFAFDPKRLEIPAGTTVTFLNDDDEAHTARAVDGSFSSGGLDRNATWKRIFATPGTYPYFCELHPDMKGTIVVVAARARS